MRPLLAAIALLTLAAPAAARQTPTFGIAADIGPAFPLGEFADDGAGRGWGMGVTATVRFTRLLGLYGSWERGAFPIEETAGNPGDGTWTDTGLGVGVRLWLPVRDSARFQPWAQIGLGRHDTDAPIARPAFDAIDTDGIVTLEGGGGVDIAIAGQTLFLRPTVRYRRYTFTLDRAEGPDSTSRVSSLTLALGLVLALNR